MSYLRVIPRDLFNESKLLKCYGQIYINLETAKAPDAKLEFDDDGPFDVQQDEEDGSIFLTNVLLTVRGNICNLRRPLNSREPWPLYLVTEDEYENIAVFNDDGSFSDEMLAFLRG